MNINEFYDSIGSSAEQVLNRLLNEKLVLKYLNKFPEDGSFASLEENLNGNDYAEAFRAAHTLKGICLNLELTPLTALAVKMCDILRNQNAVQQEDIFAVFEELSTVYKQIVDKISLIA